MFYPVQDSVPKQVVINRANALYKVEPSKTKNGRLSLARRESIGWPGLKMDYEEKELPEFLRMGNREVRDLDHSLIALAISEEAVLSNYPLPTLVIGFALWSDSCDPNSSLSKKNRGSVWALLLTLCCKIMNVNPFSYTYLVAVGESVSLHSLERNFILVIPHILPNPKGL